MRESGYADQIIRDIQRRLLEYLESEITDELAGYSFSGINLNWDDLNDMDKPDAINSDRGNNQQQRNNSCKNPLSFKEICW